VLQAYSISFDALHQKVPYKDIEEEGKENGIKYFFLLTLIILGIVTGLST